MSNSDYEEDEPRGRRKGRSSHQPVRVSMKVNALPPGILPQCRFSASLFVFSPGVAIDLNSMDDNPAMDYSTGYGLLCHLVTVLVTTIP